MTPNGQLAAATLGLLEGLGVKNYIVCAGARNAPLVTSLLAGGETKGLSVWHHFDERAAAFFALGLAKRNGEPTAVLTTSGTAAAELLPAAIEAYYSGIPLVLVTADRPERFRGSGAPQAIEQVGIFGPYALESDLDGTGEWTRDEPLHFNLCFEEPSPDDRITEWGKVKLPEPEPCRASSALAAGSDFCRDAERAVVLLGELEEGGRSLVEGFLGKLRAPIWSESTSGLRECEALADLLVRDEEQIAKYAPTHVLRIGGVPSLRYWRDLETLPEIEVLSVTKRPFSGLARDSTVLPLSRFSFAGAAEDERGWVDDPTGLSEGGSDVEQGACPVFECRLAHEAGPAPYSMSSEVTHEQQAIAELSRHIPSEALVYLGNSLPIREWNAAASIDIQHSHCFASRGANGIDGQIATFLGLSGGEPEAWGIFGDLTALYDLNAPALLDQLAAGSRRIVILNNGGGRIFSRLPSMSGLTEAEKGVTENRHSCRFNHWAAMWGMGYAAWKVGDEFPEIPEGNSVIEILIDSE